MYCFLSKTRTLTLNAFAGIFLLEYFHICAKTVEFCKCVNITYIIFNFQTEKISKEILIV